MKRITIDGHAVTSPTELHAALFREMHLPEHYGHNLDALYDVLTELREPVCIAVTASAAAKNALGEYWWRFLEVIADANGETGVLRLLLM